MCSVRPMLTALSFTAHGMAVLSVHVIPSRADQENAHKYIHREARRC